MKNKEIDFNKMTIEARPHATALAQKMALIANSNREYSPSAFAALIGEIALQNILLSILVSQVEPGSKKGEELIAELYDAFKKTAMERWHKEDLKRHFGSN